MKLKRLIKTLIAKVIKSKTIQFDEFTFKGAFQDYGLLKAISNNNHEEYFKSLFISHIKPGMTVVDIGAHLGKYSLIAGKQVGTSGKVMSFEPHPRTYQYLRSNIESNHLAQRISTYHCAVSEENGSARLQADLLQSDFSSLAAVRESSEVTSVEIPTTTLASVAPNSNPDVYKVDVEGAERLVLRGIQEVIVKSRKQGGQPVLFIEANSSALSAFSVTPKDLFFDLEQLGFKSIQKIDETNKSLTSPDLKSTDICENWICQ